MSNEYAIEVKNLKKSYKQRQVLDGVDFKVPTGSIFALLGSNGAGKTTTVKILSTLLKADDGEVKICGYNVPSQAKKVREVISLTGQYAAVDASLTGRENLQMIGRLFHVKNMNSKLEDLLSQFELTHAADRRSSTYSGGMRRKLDIAMSLLSSPKVLFLDEPTTGLDPQNRIVMWKMISELRNKGVTIFLTTQYLEEAEILADYVTILDGGKITASGTVEDLKKLLPSGSIEVSFDAINYERAKEVLKEWKLTTNDEIKTINVMTDGSVNQLTELLIHLKKADVQSISLSQKQPTLEDVFLTQIGMKQGGV